MSEADRTVYEFQSEDNATIFVRKDWCSPIIDQSNGSYRSNQSVMDTSSISNSGLWANYREAYLTVPMVLTATGTAIDRFLQYPTKSLDYGFGLKSWYGQLIHSLQVEFVGTTVCQSVPFSNLWNYFKLITTLSMNDVKTMGASIGFYPDNALSIAFATAASTSGIGTCNNSNYQSAVVVAGADNSYDSCNEGFLKRQQYINYDPDGLTATALAAYSTLFSSAAANSLYKSYIYNKIQPAVAGTDSGVFQQAIMGTIYLRHLHDFFNQLPLMKGVFLRITLWLNQPQVTLDVNALAMSVTSSVNPQGGTCPLMVASAVANNGCANLVNGANETLIATLFVGKKCENSTQTAVGAVDSPLDSQISLHVPLYTFSADFEAAYIANRVKRIVYTDIYNYRQENVAASGVYNVLVTNGIAGIQSVLVQPYYTSTANGGVLPIQSPFDTASATTSPLCLQTNFQVSVGGQNMFMNNVQYSYQAFLENLYGCNAIQGGLVDGINSGLIGQLDFEMGYCFYYANCSRMMSVEQAVPKSVTIRGQNMSGKAIDLYVFIAFKQEIAIDCLTGLRVEV